MDEPVHSGDASATRATDADTGADTGMATVALAPVPTRPDGKPVFVDGSGRRGRQLRRFGWLMGIVCAVYAVVLVASLLGADARAPWLPLPGEKAVPKVSPTATIGEVRGPAGGAHVRRHATASATQVRPPTNRGSATVPARADVSSSASHSPAPTRSTATGGPSATTSPTATASGSPTASPTVTATSSPSSGMSFPPFPTGGNR